jgi:hypothetical protein
VEHCGGGASGCGFLFFAMTLIPMNEAEEMDLTKV